jgi:xanthine dehydrogenase accessory factor
MIDWLEWLRAVAGHKPAALVSVLAVEGSAPRGPGTRMVVTVDGLFGTIGGGQLEYRVVEQARSILAYRPGTWRVQDYPLGPLLGQCCGGRVRVLIEHVDPEGLGWIAEAGEATCLVTMLGEDMVTRATDREAVPLAPPARGPRPEAGARFVETLGRKRRPVYLFGAGHVGQAIARHGAGLPLRFAWFDTRAELGTVDTVTIVAEGDIETCIADAPEDAAILILTHDHGLDYRLTRAALARPATAFVGLIGSATKRTRFLSRLADEGVSEEARGRLTCPIGLAGIEGKEPDVIAIATLAQLLQLPAC